MHFFKQEDLHKPYQTLSLNAADIADHEPIVVNRDTQESRECFTI